MSETHSIDLLSDEAFGWYLTGLTDGEGSFLLTRSRVSGKRFPKWCTRFNITMRADETTNLRAICRRMKCGTIYERFSPGCPGNPVSSWQVFRRQTLADVIVPHFERFPLQLKKAKDFVIWKSCVFLLCEISRREQSRRAGATRLRPSEHDFLVANMLQLRAIRAYISETKLSPEAQDG
jgi:hypothetical protein